MADQFIFNAKTSLMNSLFLGDTGNRFASPEIRQIIAQNQTRDAVQQLNNIQMASLQGQRISLELQRDAVDGLRDLNDGVASGFKDLGSEVSSGLNTLGQEMATGMSGLRGEVTRGFEGLGQQVEGLTAVTEDGFTQVGLAMQSGFQAMVKGLYRVDDRLGRRLVAGFRMVTTQLAAQHEETIGTLMNGFDAIGAGLEQIGASLEDAIHNTGASLVAATYDAAAQLAAANSAAIRQQTEAQLAALRAIDQRLADINHNLRHSAGNEAEEHFVVGMRFLNAMYFHRARAQFKKAKEAWAGHYPTHVADGLCAAVLGDRGGAQASYECAFAQASDDPRQGPKERALAALYLGRLLFDRERYGGARRWYFEAWKNDSGLLSALLEGAACLILDQTRPDKRADALAVKQQLNGLGPNLASTSWYTLALLLVPFAQDWATEAFRHGAAGDDLAQQHDRTRMIALLWRLNPRNAGMLLALLERDFPWLSG